MTDIAELNQSLKELEKASLEYSDSLLSPIALKWALLLRDINPKMLVTIELKTGSRIGGYRSTMKIENGLVHVLLPDAKAYIAIDLESIGMVGVNTELSVRVPHAQ